MSLEEMIIKQFANKALDKLKPAEIVEHLVQAAEAKLKQLKEDRNHNGVVDGVEIAQKLSEAAKDLKDAFDLLALAESSH